MSAVSIASPSLARTISAARATISGVRAHDVREERGELAIERVEQRPPLVPRGERALEAVARDRASSREA